MLSPFPLRQTTDAAVPSTEKVMPPRDTDATRLNFPLPLAVTLFGLAATAAAGVWRIETKVAQMTTAMEYERQLDAERQKLLDQRFAALEAKIEAAGLRNAAISMYQELQKPKPIR